MIDKLKQWWKSRKAETPTEVTELYTREEVLNAMERAKLIGYNDGKRDGIAIAREQATKSLKEIIWQQNQSKTK